VLCGAPASEPYALLDTFTARDTLAVPGSAYRCAGCAVAMEEAGKAVYPDGTAKEWTKAFRRCHSWTITDRAAVPYTGAHAAALRAFVLDPPAPPWAACVVGPTNGRQMLYLTPLNLDPHWCAVLVGGERVRYTRASLRERFRLTVALAAAGGLPSLDSVPAAHLASAAVRLYGARAEGMLVEWQAVREQPLSRLAVWLTPKKEECARVLDELGGVAAA
jgi:hypothetical protein